MRLTEAALVLFGYAAGTRSFYLALVSVAALALDAWLAARAVRRSSSPLR